MLVNEYIFLLESLEIEMSHFDFQRINVKYLEFQNVYIMLKEIIFQNQRF